MPKRFNDSLLLVEQTPPATPATGLVALYVKADGLVYSMDDAGVETVVTGGGGGSSKTYLTRTIARATFR